MRFVIMFAAGLLWSGIATAQTTPQQSPPSEPAATQTAAPTDTATDANAPVGVTVTQQGNHEQQIVCRTILATGSRLAGRGHGTRTCKTRAQWELEEADLQRRVVGIANQSEFQADPMQHPTSN